MKLYYKPGTCALAPHIVLEELELDHSLVKVDLQTKTTETGDDFLAINGKGYVPALEMDNGHILTEGVVISQYLADLDPEAALIPASGEARYQLLSMMSFISTELHKPMGSMFNPAQTGDWKEATKALLTRRLDWLSKTLADKSFIAGPGFTVADAYLFTVLSWAQVVNFSLDPWPTLQAYLGRIAERPAVQRALKAEGLI
ncbi:MAG: glutathione transferase GstA [Pseudomonadota bacterium]|uniref:glutathione transferase GstA n=1 Tax=Gallaecimonas pentaromativorans TaxID=584787 RepID=UPI00067F4750|nr:glutathione transferase GstA [Gallaecimonas pentaromativorans]MED5525254.1 glutathione transferase GstA [Pseudomonadota bacterium]